MLRRPRGVACLVAGLVALGVPACGDPARRNVPDTSAPRAGVSSPADGATWIPPAAVVTAWFSEALDPSTVNSSTVTVRDAFGNPVAGTVTYEASDLNGFTYASLRPTSPLAPSTLHVATVTTGITDRAGNHLPAALTWTFTTGPTGSGAWSPMSVVDAPQVMVNPVGIWTGDEALVWDSICACGGRHDPTQNSWRPMSTVGGPTNRLGETAVWTGRHLIVWGGEYWAGGYIQSNQGWRYDPVTGGWEALPTAGAPEGRTGHVAVWTGEEMLIWGGRKGNVSAPIYLTSGGRYDPASNTWGPPMSPTGAPSPRSIASEPGRAVWTGSEMIVWGGAFYRPSPLSNAYLNDGARYSPATNSWRSMSMQAAPAGRDLHAMVWTGEEMIVWGGLGNDPQDAFGDPVELGSGGRYDPATDTWSPTGRTDAPAERWGHTAIWTGSEMIVWGGRHPYGGRYEPVADIWQATTPDDAPISTTTPAAMWTGSEMIVWSGGSGTAERSGGRYTP